MNSIDLKGIVNKYPHEVSSISTLRALLRDMFPEYQLEINLICMAYTLGIPDKIRNKSFLPEQEIYNLTSNMENNYGVAYQYAYYAIETWAGVYGVKCSPMVNHIQDNGKPLNNVDNRDQYPGNNEIIWEDENIRVTYKNIEALDMSKAESISAQFYMNCIIKNKTANDMYVTLFDVEMNDIVFENIKGGLDPISAGKTRIMKFIFDAHKLYEMGYRNNDEFNEMRFEIAYAYQKHFFKPEMKEASQEVVIGINV